MTSERKINFDSLEMKHAELEVFTRKWKAEMMRRAMAAYFRQGGLSFPSPYASRIVLYKGTHYAYLASESETLAVYRIRSDSSFSRKAKRWPKQIENVPVSRRAMINYSHMRRVGLVEYHAGA